MNREALYEALGDIDEMLLERSEKAPATGRKMWKMLLPLAACFAVVLLSAALLGRDFFSSDPIAATEALKPTQTATEAAHEPTRSMPQPTGPATIATEPRETVPAISPDSWELVYNEANFSADPLIATPFGYFAEEMSQAQISRLLPDALMEREDIRGTAHYKAGNELWYASLNVPVGNYFVKVLFERYPTCMLGKPDGVTSVCGDVEYYVMEWIREKKIQKNTYVPTETPGVYMVEKVETGEVELITEKLEAEANINGVPVFFIMYVDNRSGNGDAEKQAFKEVLSAFATYPEYLPASSKITPLEPQNSFYYVYYDCSLEKARKDETFGSYLPRQMPENWKIVYLERKYREGADPVNSLQMIVVEEEEQIYFSWNISEASPVSARLQSQEKITRLMTQMGRVDLNCGGAAVQVRNLRYENEIDSQWLYEQLAALPMLPQQVKAAVCTGAARVEYQRYLEVLG